MASSRFRIRLQTNVHAASCAGSTFSGGSESPTAISLRAASRWLERRMTEMDYAQWLDEIQVVGATLGDIDACFWMVRSWVLRIY